MLNSHLFCWNSSRKRSFERGRKKCERAHPGGRLYEPRDYEVNYIKTHLCTDENLYIVFVLSSLLCGFEGFWRWTVRREKNSGLEQKRTEGDGWAQLTEFVMLVVHAYIRVFLPEPFICLTRPFGVFEVFVVKLSWGNGSTTTMISSLAFLIGTAMKRSATEIASVWRFARKLNIFCQLFKD